MRCLRGSLAEVEAVGAVLVVAAAGGQVAWAARRRLARAATASAPTAAIGCLIKRVSRVTK